MSARAAERRGLRPHIEPFARGMLEVAAGHVIYFEQSGNPDGLPVLVVHGGPGGGSHPVMRRFHDPDTCRIILFDQRGCGRSQPHASLEANTTLDLVADIERLRRHLGIRRWQLFGGSWGSTLALVYALRHPERVSALVLRGIFLARQREIAWFYQEGCNWLFPEAYAEFQALIPDAERGDMLRAYYDRLTSPDLELQLAAARAWCRWEASTLALSPDPAHLRQAADPAFALALARIECHYFVHRAFLERDGDILAKAPSLAHIPGSIIHGRYDMVTPVRSAVELHEAWPGSVLKIVPDAGHALTEPGIVHELMVAADWHVGTN